DEGVFPDSNLDTAAEIGAVTDLGVRVWVRQPNSDRVPIRLQVDGRDAVVGFAPVSPDSDWTGVANLALREPAPDRPFTVAANGRVLSGRLAPAPGAHVDF